MGNIKPPKLEVVTNSQLNYWLSRFVVEARNTQGKLYTGVSLYGLCAGIQRYIRDKRIPCNEEVLDIYKDPNFSLFRRAFDCVLKDLHKEGIGTIKRQAAIISTDLEECMWNDGLLGDSNPHLLLDTMVYCLGLNLALRSGREHRSLCPAMIQLHESKDARPYLLYSERGSKNNAGGFQERKVTNKTVKIFGNKEDPKRCVVELYKKYMSFRPVDAPPDAFCLQPVAKPSPDQWYLSRPVGHNTLNETVKRLCDKAGEKGHYTNHSLRRTCATCLFQHGVDEQTIMSVTGHRSTDAVRVYKKISHEQQEEVSDVIQAKKSKTTHEEDDFAEGKEPGPTQSTDTRSSKNFTFTNCTVNFNNC